MISEKQFMSIIVCTFTGRKQLQIYMYYIITDLWEVSISSSNKNYSNRLMVNLSSQS